MLRGGGAHLLHHMGGLGAGLPAFFLLLLLDHSVPLGLPLATGAHGSQPEVHFSFLLFSEHKIPSHKAGVRTDGNHLVKDPS